MSPQTASGRWPAAPEVNGHFIHTHVGEWCRLCLNHGAREAQALVLDALEAAVRAHLEPKHWALGNDDPEDYRRRCVDIHCGAFVDRGQHKEGCGVAAVLDAIQQQRSKP